MLANTVTYNDNDVINLDNMLANDLSNNDRSNVVNLDNTLAHIVLQT